MKGQGAMVSGATGAEKMLLGSLMTSPGAADTILDRVVCEDFCRIRHRLIYAGICELARKGVFGTPEVLGAWMESRGTLGAAGGYSYLKRLADNPAPNGAVALCSEAVRDGSVLRRLAEAARETLDDIEAFGGGDASFLLAKAEQRVVSVADGGARGRIGLTPVGRVLPDVFQVLQDGYNAGGRITGLATGYTELDAMTAGLQPADLIIVGGRPAMGKTTFALNIVEHVAIRAESPVAVFSMGMSANQLAMRLISSIGRINTGLLRTGKLEDEDWSRVAAAIRTLRDAPIFIDDTPTLSPETLRSKARQLKREHGLGLVVIDYLQLMQVPGMGEHRGAELADVSRSIKAMARELNVPVIALSQLSRSLELRKDKRPVMADLRDSGALEDDADVIVFIYRDHYYNRESSPDKSLAEIIVAKQRNGPTGHLNLRFLAEYQRFEGLAGTGKEFD